MHKAEEDLKAILDLLAEWRKDYGVGYVNMYIMQDGYGAAYNLDNSGYGYEARAKYEPWEGCREKGPAEATAGAKETENEITPLV